MPNRIIIIIIIIIIAIIVHNVYVTPEKKYNTQNSG